ncbi:hypothetical protein LTR37_006971 [Vermiconidia calcicola]|uniref:Uncharacterized protein n=1 Tax=Vermiconidia calcicola TaxID=1690605 RepID=A0ACC3NF97_9PEZI|nr:hypothetical protein LTR37_006971 [Vermiconidia calcicola]
MENQQPGLPSEDLERLIAGLSAHSIGDTYVGVAQTDAESQDGHATTASQTPNEIIYTYLKDRVPEFQKLTELRQKASDVFSSPRRRGWENPGGDEYFQNQRRKADHADKKERSGFYKMMRKLGFDLNTATDGFVISRVDSEPKRILDMCMAPGGFLQAAIELNPTASARAYTLPFEDGGHEVLLPRKPNVNVRFRDITMLAADMDATEIMADHADADKFLPQEFNPKRLYDLVLCDGQVLRTHPRASYRDHCEVSRLTTTQLALGLEHLRPGGTMIVLLHKVEKCYAVMLLNTFRKFSTLQLYKPEKAHAKRSSFYMIASNIQSRHPEAISAIAEWKNTWRVATFGNEDEYKKAMWVDAECVTEVLREFGPELIAMARPIWAIQAEALADAPFVKDS